MRLRKFFRKEMLTEQMNQVLRSENDYNVASSRSNVSKSNTEETEKKQGKRKKDSEEINEMELEWKPADCAHPYGEVSKVTGEGDKKTNHFDTFMFHGNQYGLEDSVVLVPEDPNQKPYYAIIKDIYIPHKERYVKIQVQWFYRPEDLDRKYVGFKDSRNNLFYSFHRDEVDAESVKRKCDVYFVPENKQIPNRREHPGFIVQNVYDIVKKKLRKFSDNEFDVHQKQEIDRLVGETISRVGDLPDIEKDQTTKILKRKRSVQKSSVSNAERTSDPGRDKRFEELMKAVKHECRTSKKQKVGDYDSYWPTDVLPVVRALEQVFYDSLAEDISKYKQKLKILVKELKKSRMLARRLLDGELKPEQVVKMTHYELMRGYTFDEITADIEDPTLMLQDVPSTSRSVERKDLLEDYLEDPTLMLQDVPSTSCRSVGRKDLLEDYLEDPTLMLQDVPSTSRSVGRKDLLED